MNSASDAVTTAPTSDVSGSDSSNPPLLEVVDIYAGYDPHQDILRGVSLKVFEGEIVCVIGPNGAGKSTVFKAIYGLVSVRKGKVFSHGKDITNIRPQDALKEAGISIVPQLRSVFAQMTVHENLELGMYLSTDKERINRRIQYVYDLFPRLAERSEQEAGTMSGGEQRMLEIGRALMWEARLVLMDEPSAGLAPIVSKAIFAAVRRLNHEIGLTVLMIEQNARQGLQASHRGYVIELGRRTFAGNAPTSWPTPMSAGPSLAGSSDLGKILDTGNARFEARSGIGTSDPGVSGLELSTIRPWLPKTLA